MSRLTWLGIALLTLSMGASSTAWGQFISGNDIYVSCSKRAQFCYGYIVNIVDFELLRNAQLAAAGQSPKL
jgi:hypothetical protein